MSTVRRRLLAAIAAGGSVLPAIGDPFLGGYYAGIIDTTRAGSILATDDSQTGARYALIVAPASLETTATYRSSADAPIPGSHTRWDGLTATAALAAAGAEFAAARYCNNRTYPTDDASRWYLPAMDELEVVFRNLKPTTETNNVSGRNTAGFPGVAELVGVNPSSNPVGSAYTSGSPAQTSVAAFQAGGGQELDSASSSAPYWTSTDYDTSNAWYQDFSSTGGLSGAQQRTTKSSTFHVRPVRRLLL